MKRIKKENLVMICVIALILALSVFFVVSMKINVAGGDAKETFLTEESSPAETSATDETETPESAAEDKDTAVAPHEAATDTESGEESGGVVSEEPDTSAPESEKPSYETVRDETKKPETTEKKDSAETRAPSKTRAAVTTSAAPPAEEAEPSLNCTISIRCDRVLEHMDRLEEAKIPYVPADGCILPTVSVEIEEGESVFDVLKYVCDTYGVQLEFSWTPIYNSSYIEGIGYLYEFDCGDESGWIYKVNGNAPNYGCSEYKLYGGESIVWSYSCDGYGADVGAGR